MSSVPSSSTQSITKRIFCYGDSLTAGTAPPSFETFPYGPHLEQELNNGECMLGPSESVMVRWRGLPGWTASVMADAMNDSSTGLLAALQGIRNPSLSLVIILAGTNDIGSLTSSMNESSDIDVSSAVDPIARLHKSCLNCEGDDGKKDMRTLAIGIPGSAWQEMNSNASKLCTDMNGALQKFASEEERVTYVDFPFPYARGDAKWSGDGLHLSREGYETLGRSLAPCVKEILDGARGS